MYHHCDSLFKLHNHMTSMFNGAYVLLLCSVFLSAIKFSRYRVQTLFFLYSIIITCYYPSHSLSLCSHYFLHLIQNASLSKFDHFLSFRKVYCCYLCCLNQSNSCSINLFGRFLTVSCCSPPWMIVLVRFSIRCFRNSYLFHF